MEPAHPRPPMRHKVFWYRLDGHKGEAILFKYSPKYIYDLIIDGSGHTTQKWVSKVKSLKIVKAFSAFPLLRTKKKRNGILPFLLNLLQRQRNYLKDIRGVDSSVLRYFPGKAHYVLNAENLMSWKSFYWLINLKSLRIMLENETSQDLKSPPKDLTKLPCQIQRFASHLKRLKKLKHVDLCIEKELSKITSLIFSKLKYSKDILKALKSLRIKMKTVLPEIMQANDCPFFEIFQYATEFEFQDAQNAPPNVIMEHFGKFSNLEVLKLTLPFENHRNEPQAVQVSLQYLKNIGDLTKLVELKIILSWLSTEYSAEFFQFFQVPASLQKFSLTIVNPKLCELIDITNSENWETNNPFDYSEVLIPFYQKWTNLEKLQSLSIRLENSDLLCIPNIAFMIPMLPKIPYLKELIFEALVTQSPGLLKKPLPWCYLWEKLEHIRSEIETLIVKEAAITLKDFSWIKQQLKMKRLELGKYVIGGQNIDFLVKPLKKKGAIVAVEEVLLVDQFVIENDEGFSRFLESFQKIPANIKLTMSADLRFVSREALVGKLLEYIPKIRKNKNLDITFVNVCKTLTKENLKEIKSALIKHESFCFLEIMSKGGHTVYLWDWKCHSKEKQENLMNETGQEFRTWIAEHDIEISENTSQAGAGMQQEEGEGEELEEFEEYDYEEDDGENESQEFDDSDFDGCEEMEEDDAENTVYNELDDIEKF